MPSLKIVHTVETCPNDYQSDRTIVGRQLGGFRMGAMEIRYARLLGGVGFNF